MGRYRQSLVLMYCAVFLMFSTTNANPNPVHNRPPRDLSADVIEAYRTAFVTFDEYKNGSVPRESVAEILEILEVPYDTESLGKIVAEFDANNSGRFEFDEFVKLMAKLLQG